METQKSAILKKAIDEQIEIIKSYVDGFEVSVPRDEAALGDIGEILKTVAQRVKEMDEARVKRKQLMDELNEAFVELERSQKQFAESVKTDTP